MSYILIVGAHSDIAKAVAQKYAKEGHDLCLSARRVHELESFSNDLNTQFGVKVDCVELDILNYASHKGFYDALGERPAGVIIAVGYLGDQIIAQSEFSEAKKIIDTNYTGVVSFLNIVADDYEQCKSGFIIAISSVAGDRGRKSNYLYGSAKAALSAYLSGLRNRLYSAGVHVLTVKPGFVATKMTEGLELPSRLLAQPEDVANDIYVAQQRNKDVLYSKWIWRWVMFIIRSIPERVFKKTSI